MYRSGRERRTYFYSAAAFRSRGCHEAVASLPSPLAPVEHDRRGL